MRNYLFFGLLLLIQTHKMFGQNDSLQLKSDKKLLVKSLIPASLILTGVLLSETQLEKNWQLDIRNGVGNDFRTTVDDYIQYVPYVQIYTGDILGLDAKNHWFDQTKNIFLGGIVNLVVSHGIKRVVDKARPGGGGHSFASGHTGTAFMGATMLYHEFSSSNFVYASSGFLFSTSTGALRIMNNRHWVSDVFAGAGIGIFVGNLIYYIEPLKNFNPFKKTKNLSFIPMIDNKGFTFSATLKF